jgi:F-box interacting protein
MVLSERIPDELMMNIFSRLPVHNLAPFRFLNKSWLSLITDDPAFKALYFDMHASDSNSRYIISIPNVFVTEARLCTAIFRYPNLVMATAPCPIPFRTPTDYYNLLCSCNGVLCMSDSPMNTKFIDSLYLWNPSVRNFKILIPSYTPLGNKKLMITTHGIGPDHRDHDLLVIRIIYHAESQRRPHTEVYSLNNNSWSSVSESVVVPCLAFDEPTAFVNGAIHWKALSFTSTRPLIMYFNTAKRVFGEIRLPVNCFDPRIIRAHSRVAVFKGLLAFIVITRINHPLSTKICDIWIMNEYGVVESWTKRFAIPISFTWFDRAFGITKNNQLLLNLDGMLFSYDLDRLQYRILGFHGVQGSFDVDSLTESLYLIETRE